MASNHKNMLKTSSDGSKRETASVDTRTEAIEFRPVRPEDLEEINALLRTVELDVGSHILRLCFENSDHKWQVATDGSGAVVAFDSNHILPLNGIICSYISCVMEKYKKRGLIRTMGSSHFTRPRIGNATAQSMIAFPKMERFDSKLVGFYGRPQLHLLRERCSDGENSRPVRITSVQTEQDMRKVLAYDREFVFLLEREPFMRAWCTESKPDEPYARTMMAEINGRVVGFGVIRQHTDYYGLQPLYANDSEVAEELLAALVRSFVAECGQEELYVYFEATNYLMMRFVHEQKFEQYNTEIRFCSNGAAVIRDYCRFDRIYAIGEYWPV